MKINKIVIGILLASFIGNFIIYPYLPEIIPMHLNKNGNINGTGSKDNIFWLGILPLLMYMFFFVMSKFDSRIKSGKVTARTYGLMAMVPVTVLIIVNWGINVISLKNTKIDARMVLTAIMAFAAIGFIIIGNYLMRIKQNKVFGIRTRWTLTNEIVWRKTHRFGGIGFIIIGILVLVLSFYKISASIIAMITLLITFCIITIIYSYIQYRNINEN